MVALYRKYWNCFLYYFRRGAFLLFRNRASPAFSATLDTNIFIRDKLEAGKLFQLLRRVPADIKYVSVSEREYRGKIPLPQSTNRVTETAVWGESRWGEAKWGGTKIQESMVLGESKLGGGRLSNETDSNVFEVALSVISSNSFPPSGKRNNLSKGQRRQLRDAMIFAAHVRENRDVFVTADAAGFIGDSGAKRFALQERYKVRIMNYEEFCSYIETL